MLGASAFVAWERKLFFRLQSLALARTEARTGVAHAKHLRTGERGEDEAYFYLRSRGFTMVARRWRTPRLRGDLDLVAWDGDHLVIVEVKSRTARDFAPAEAEVDEEKQRMLRRMAAAYVRQFPERHRDSMIVRFDVLSVYLLGETPEIVYFRNAFPYRTDR